MKAAPRILVVVEEIDRSEAALGAGLHAGGLTLRVRHHPTRATAAALATLREAGVPCAPLIVRSRLDGRAARDLRDELRSGRFDVVYAPINRTLAAALRATRGLAVPVVAYRGTVGHLHRWDPAAWLTYFHPRLRHVVCVSDAVRRHLVEDLRLPPGRVSRIYKGHDPDWYSHLTATTPLPPTPAGTLTVAFAGRVRPVKGVRYLLDACRLLPDDVLRIVLIGPIDDPDVARRLRDPAIAPRVFALGPCSDAAALIGRCDALALPSVAREGLPRAAIEAMAQGVPVIASRVGGLPEVVEDGVTGLLAPPRDARALAEALLKLHADPALRARLGAGGRARVARRFHIRDTVAAYTALFRQLANAPGH